MKSTVGMRNVTVISQLLLGKTAYVPFLITLIIIYVLKEIIHTELFNISYPSRLGKSRRRVSIPFVINCKVTVS